MVDLSEAERRVIALIRELEAEVGAEHLTINLAVAYGAGAVATVNPVEESEMEIESVKPNRFFPAFRDADGNRFVWSIQECETREAAERWHGLIDEVVEKVLGHKPDGVFETWCDDEGYIHMHFVKRGDVNTPGEECVIAGPYLDQRCRCGGEH